MAGFAPRVKMPAAKPGAVGLPGGTDPALAAEMEQRQADNLQDLQFPQIDAPDDALAKLSLDPGAVRAAPGSIGKIQPLPVVANPDVLDKAQRDLALLGIVRSFTGRAPLTVAGVRQGHFGNDPLTPNPGADALQALAMAPVAREQARVQAANSGREALNALAMGQAGNVNQNAQLARERADRESAAKAAAATQAESAREFDVSQETAKRGQDKTVEAARVRQQNVERKMLEAQNKPPETPVRESARLANEMMDFSDQLEGLIKKGGGDTSDLAATVNLGHLQLGTADARRAQQLMGAIKGHLAQVEERRKGNQTLDQAIGGIVPMAGDGAPLSMKALNDVRKIGNGIHEATAQMSPLWAYQSGIPRLKAHVTPQMLQRTQKTYSQQLEDALREQQQGGQTFDPDAFLKGGE